MCLSAVSPPPPVGKAEESLAHSSAHIPTRQREMGQALFFSALIYSSLFNCLPTSAPTAQSLHSVRLIN